MPQLKKETHTQQSILADYCRNGIFPEGLLDINKDNLHNYRRLCYNIAVDVIETAYPIAFSFLPEETWNKLLSEFYSEHKCQTPQVWRMPLEFYDYCLQKNICEILNFPFLNDLLYFEWLELDVHTMEDIQYPKTKAEGDWLNDKIALNPEHKLIRLSYPVHTTAPTEGLLEKKGDYFLLIYREKDTGNVQFVDLSMFYTYILENLMNGVLLKDILVEANSIFQINDIKLLKDRSLEFIEDLKRRNFVIGFTA
ncbi:MAG: putative DNA-binding domain-containing protein [Bacteroidetes bacterium]|nr:putative DNA-binding domain-containing protein [Bacteroidota bacterium]